MGTCRDPQASWPDVPLDILRVPEDYEISLVNILDYDGKSRVIYITLRFPMYPWSL
jgi:hypothetical protein